MTRHEWELFAACGIGYPFLMTRIAPRLVGVLALKGKLEEFVTR